MQKNSQGYIALITVLIIASVALAISINISLLGIGVAQSSLANVKGENALQLAEGCAEDGLLKSQQSSTYSGGNITRPEGTCFITVTKSGNNWGLIATSSQTDYNRTVQVNFTRTSGSPITISSWQESLPVPTPTPTPPPPPAPTGLTATPGNASVTLNWNAIGGDYYDIYVEDVTAGQTSYTKLPYPVTTNSFTDSPLTNGHTYSFEVSTIDTRSVEGPTSSPVSAVPNGSLLAGYNYVGTITINNTSNSNTLTNYQIAVPVNTASLITAGKMRSDCADTRFTASDGTTLLNYYLVSGCNTSTTTYYVKVPSITASTNTTILINYGNPSAVTASSGRNTFVIFEDMTIAPAGTLKGSATYDSTNKWVQFTTANTFMNGELEYATGTIGLNPNDGYVADYQEYSGGSTATPPADATWLYAYDTSTPPDEDSGHGGYLYANDEFSSQEQLQFNGTSLTTPAQANIGDGSWHSIEITYTPYISKLTFDGATDINFTDATRSITGTLFGFGGRTGGTNDIHRVRAIQVRKYAVPTPSVTVSL
jgi:hypothetical protein